MKEKSRKEVRKQSKQYIRTMTKGRPNVFRSSHRIFKYGTISFFRNIWLSIASTLVMTITLIILCATVLSNLILSETASEIKNKIDITIFLKPETTNEDLDKLKTQLEKNENVKPETIAINSSEKELEIFIDENKDNPELIEAISDEAMKEIMLKTMQSTIRFKVKDPDNLDDLKSLIENTDDFSKHLDEEKKPTYDMNKTEIETINSWANIAKNGGIILGIIFLTISILIIFNTIRMAIFSRREEIYMMKLVGAGKRFVSGPFLIEAELCGVISGIIASLICYYGFKSLEPSLTSYGINITKVTTFIESSDLILFFGAMILIGIIIGAISARLALKRYLRKL